MSVPNCCAAPVSSRHLAQPAGSVFLFMIALCLPTPANGDVIQFFNHVLGVADGEFGWDDFGLTGSPYEGPHAPDQFQKGTGVGSLSVSPAGGLITGTNNLYSFMTVPTWTTSFSGLDQSNDFTSIAIQIATSATLDSSHFSLSGESPDAFLDLGPRTEVGGFPYNFYWAEWQGLVAQSSISISVTGTEMHQSLAGAKASYFNTAAPFDISGFLFDFDGVGSGGPSPQIGVPEPSSGAVLTATVLLFWSTRRRRR